MALALRCPECHAPLPQLPCCEKLVRLRGGEAGGIPILLSDPAAVQEAISAARSTGRAAWYEAPHADQWAGPYRHRLAKRRVYLDATLSRFAPAGDGARRLALDLGCGDGEHLGWLGGWAEEVVGTSTTRCA